MIEHRLISHGVVGVVRRVIGCKSYGFIHIPFDCRGFEEDVFFKLSWFEDRLPRLPIAKGDVVQFDLFVIGKKTEARNISLLPKDEEVDIAITA